MKSEKIRIKTEVRNIISHTEIVSFLSRMIAFSLNSFIMLATRGKND
jgi:hypothetical protein